MALVWHSSAKALEQLFKGAAREPFTAQLVKDTPELPLINARIAAARLQRSEKLRKEVVPKIEDFLNYTFTDKDKCWQAVQCKSYLFPYGNKRLALVGDAYIRTIFLKTWYLTGESTYIGNKYQQTAATNARFNTVGRGVNLPHFMQNWIGGATTDPAASLQVADTVEAIVGAVALDGGEHAAEGVMQKLGLIPAVEISTDTDKLV